MKKNTLAPLALDLLNALDAHIVVLDAKGAIVAVNEAWRRFARENGGDDASVIGASYLAVCEEANRGGAVESAREMLEGVGLLLRGERDSFSVEYPCHSPVEQRWFLARVTRFTHEGATHLVAVHEERARIAACREIGAGEVEVTVSVGVTEMAPSDDTLERLIQRADQAMYEAKKAGRDRSRVIA